MSKIAALASLVAALCISVPALAATEGAPGGTSSALFNATLTLTNPAQAQVELIGLDDFNFPTIGLVSGVPQSSLGNQVSYFCMKRSNPGNVFITVTQSGHATGSFKLYSDIDSNGDAIIDNIPIDLSIGFTATDLHSISNGVASVEMQSPSNCTSASSGIGIASRFSMAPIIMATYLPGHYTGTFNVLLTPE